ncbi:hypothetical protein DYB38_007796 [Aphanomyces astaci]|uniref:Uncharacterized protein n=1 Tax=Aphanomyces astaci TaxID=112090 RepID=A0A397A367_APHAT|nr:hypothetical protein DYB36_003070 [Aphanomyces astaci]RHY51012.1 hypothetical protein DYB38_007796 [Aphanomyces astaci]RHY56601.1 hypothetical protein DYB34_003828 [Aphanomyces astaci]RHZ24096.1 hypothetical protein DYB31_004305 [Aphanomyces astaci]
MTAPLIWCAMTFISTTDIPVKSTSSTAPTSTRATSSPPAARTASSSSNPRGIDPLDASCRRSRDATSRS